MSSESGESGSSDHSPTLSPKSPLKSLPDDAEELDVFHKNVLSLSNLKITKSNHQIKELQTILRDQETSRSDFIFYADRLIRIVVEEGLNCMPSYSTIVTTPTGQNYEGIKFQKMNCAVSIVRSGEAMEKGLRDCCRSIRIGKILIKRDSETKETRVYYAKFPPSIEQRKILLLYPVLETGATVQTAINVLKEHGVKESNIVFVNLFSSYKGAQNLLTKFPNLTMLTSEIHEFSPNHFGFKYFGSD